MFRPSVIDSARAAQQAVLSRSDSGFDSARPLFLQDDERQAWAQEGRRFEYLVKWNPRQQRLEEWVDRADAAGVWTETRPGKRVALLDLGIERAWQKKRRTFRLLVRLVERTIDKRGQALLLPEYQLDGWWTSLDERRNRSSNALAPMLPMSSTTANSRAIWTWSACPRASSTATT